MKQREILKEYINSVYVEANENYLAELLYTASEVGLIDPIASIDAVVVAKLVALSNTVSPELIKKIRM